MSGLADMLRRFVYGEARREARKLDSMMVLPIGGQPPRGMLYFGKPPNALLAVARKSVGWRCAYCGNCWPETQDRCPTCGAVR